MGFPHGMNVKFGLWTFHKLYNSRKFLTLLSFGSPNHNAYTMFDKDSACRTKVFISENTSKNRWQNQTVWFSVTKICFIIDESQRHETEIRDAFTPYFWSFEFCCFRQFGMNCCDDELFHAFDHKQCPWSLAETSCPWNCRWRKSKKSCTTGGLLQPFLQQLFQVTISQVH